MPELPGFPTTLRPKLRAVRVAEVAERQGGVISVLQLVALGISRSTVKRWAACGRLHLVYPGVYAVGHRALGAFGRLNAALLYAGDEAALSFHTATWWWGFTEAEPTTIHVSEPGERRNQPGLRLHHPRRVAAVEHKGLRVTTVPRTLRDYASVMSYSQLRRVLAEADHKRKLVPAAVYAELGRGRRGSAALRRAMAEHLPELAATFSVLEERFLALIADAGLPMPEVNEWVEGMRVDCLWRKARLIVELDGHESHARAAAIEVDRRREMRLRRAGFEVLRYTWQQVTQEPHLIVAELTARLAPFTNCPEFGPGGG